MTAAEIGVFGQPMANNVEIRNNKEENLKEIADKCELVRPTPTPQPRPTITPAVSTPTPTPAPEPKPNPESVGQVVVRTSTDEGRRGTGFVIGLEGDRAYVVTNHHVVEDAETMVFALGDYGYDDVTLLGSHEHEDVAVLSVCCAMFTALSSSTMPVTPGTEVEVAAMPGESEEVIRTRGKVLRLTQQYGSSSPVIEHTAELHPGSSGSPLLNADGVVIGINKGTNVKDATKFVATSYASVKSLIARWTGQVVSEADVAPAEPSMWVIVTDDEVYVDTEFDFTDEFGMDVFVDGEEYCNPQRIYADEGRYALRCESPDKPHASAERVSVQTDGGFDMRCQKDEELSGEQETVFACVWR